MAITGIFSLILALFLGYQVRQLFVTYDMRYLYPIGVSTFLLFMLMVLSQPVTYVPVGN